MKAKPSEIDAFAKRLTATPDASAPRAVLLFGPNQGLAENLKDTLLAQFKAEDGMRLWLGPEIKKSPAALRDDLGGDGLFASRKAAVVKDMTEASGPAFLAAAQELVGNPDRLLIGLAGELKGSSKLKKGAEEAAHTLACACWEEKASDLDAFLIATATQEHGMRLAPQVAAEIRALIGDNRLLLKSALANCALYALGEDQIDLNTVEACLISQTASTLDQALQAIFAGQTASASMALAKINGDETALLIACQRHALRLTEVKLAMESGASYQAASAKLRPPVFWKQKDSFQRQVARYSSALLSRLTSKFADLTLKARGGHDSQGSYIAQELLSITDILARSGK